MITSVLPQYYQDKKIQLALGPMGMAEQCLLRPINQKAQLKPFSRKLVNKKNLVKVVHMSKGMLQM